MDEDEILYQSIIADPERVDPDVDVSRFKTATPTSPTLLADVAEYSGLQFDPTQTSYLADLYDLYSTGVPVIETPDTGTAGDVAAETAITTPTIEAPVKTPSENQVTGDIELDTTFQDAGAIDVPGTIGTLGDLTEPTTEIAPTVNILDEFGTAGNVYADVPPQKVNVPALDLSGTSTDLINQGVIETPQEFYGRTYNDIPSNYELLDNEEQIVVDQQYADAYGLAPVPKPATTIRDLPIPSVQAAFALKDAFDDATAPSLSETIDFDTYADPGVDAEENQPENITLETNVPDVVTGEALAVDPIVDPDEITTGLTFETPAEQIYGDDSSPSPASEPDYSGFDSGGYDPAPAPVNDPTDRGGGDSGGDDGGKIVCTMMNKTYGFGSFRNKIWLRQSKDLAPEYQKGYHVLFLPLVKIAKTNKIVRKILEHIAVHRTIDIRQESRGKIHMLGRIYRKILEPICYWMGKYAKR